MTTRIRRGAFTLVELLIVITIIAALVALSLAGVFKVFERVPQVQTRTEISQLDVALHAFMTDFSITDPPPSKLNLYEYIYSGGVQVVSNTDPSYQFIRRCFPRIDYGTPRIPKSIDWNGDGIINGPWTLEGEQCLIFYIGGIPNAIQQQTGSPPGCLGFAMDVANPANNTLGISRKGPYYEFKTAKLLPGVGGFFTCLDYYVPKTGRQPYAYFSSWPAYSITDCASIGAQPYWTSQDTSGNPIMYTFAQGYQIISAGADGGFGGGLWNPISGATGNGQDDLANFSGTILRGGQ